MGHKKTKICGTVIYEYKYYSRVLDRGSVRRQVVRGDTYNGHSFSLGSAVEDLSSFTRSCEGSASVTPGATSS